MVDTLMIAALPNSDTLLSAVGMAGKLSWLLNLTLFGFTSGAAVFISQYWGVKDMKGIHRSYGFALMCAAVTAIIFTAIGRFCTYPVMRMFTGSQKHIELGASYMEIACFSYLAVALTNIFSTVLRSTEKVRLPMYVSISGTLLNAGLNALFIFGMDMGLRGAAIATAISAWTSPIILFIISLKQRNVLIAPLKAMFGWSKRFVKKYIGISLPVLLNETLWAVGTIGFQLIYTNKDPDFFAAMTVYGTLEGIVFVFFVGLCHACTVMVGKSVGAGDREQALLDGRRFSILVPTLSLVVAAVLILSRNTILLAFNISDEMRAVAGSIIIIAGSELVLRHIPYITIVGVFRAGGDTRTGLLYDVACIWGISLPLTLLSAYVFNLPLIWVYAIMLFAEDTLKTVLCIRRLVSGKWFRPVTEHTAQNRLDIPVAEG